MTTTPFSESATIAFGKVRRTMTLAFAAAIIALALPYAPASATSILFIGNSFTNGQGSAVETYMPGTVTDLNFTSVGGIPALFKSFTVQAGLSYDVSLETVGGAGLDYHYLNKAALISQPWDNVVMHGYSTLDAADPGNPAKLITYSKLIAELLDDKNSAVDVHLMATWARADQTYLPGGHWYGQPISGMANDIKAAYDQAADNTPLIEGVIPVGTAWDRAIKTGFADANPYDGITVGTVDLWAADNYHASLYGSYLEALTIFGSLTGIDPRSLGANELVAAGLGITPWQAMTMQNIAYAELNAVPEPSSPLLMALGIFALVWIRRRTEQTE